MKKIFKAVTLLCVFSFLFCSCSYSNQAKFDELETGENFMGSRDGYYKKLPHNYCLNIHLRSKAYLFRVPDEYTDVEWDSSLYYDCVILEGHFIKGYFTLDYLVLCEEKDNDVLQYLTFDYSTAQIQYHLEIAEIYKLINVDSFEWFALCNTNKEIQRIK